MGGHFNILQVSSFPSENFWNGTSQYFVTATILQENLMCLKIEIRSKCAKEIEPKTMERMTINAKELEAVSLKIYRKLYLLPLIA